MENSKYIEIFKKSPIGILFYDKGGVLTDANQSALDIAAISSLDDIIGTNLFDNPYIKSNKKELIKNGLIRFESPINLDKIKEYGIYNPTKTGLIHIDYTISITDNGFLTQIQDITERKKAEEELRESEKKLNALFENLTVGISVLNNERTVIYENPALVEIIGLSKEELKIGKYAERRYFKSDLTEISSDELPSAIAFNKQTPIHNVEVGILKEDNTMIWTNVSAIPLNFLDWKMLIVTSNITEEKKIKEELMGKQAELKTLFENIPAGIVLFDAKSPYTVLVHNKYYQEFFAEPYRTQGMMGLNIYEYAPKVDAEGVVDVFNEVIRTKKAVEYLDFPYKSNYPDQSWFDWYMLPVIVDGKVVSLVSMSIDVTHRHNIEEALQESYERFDLAQKVSNIGTFEWNIQTGVNVWTKELEAMYGLQEGEFKGTQEAWKELVHPEDMPEAVKKVNIALETGKPGEAEFRVVWPDKSIHWLLGRWQIIIDDNTGNPLKLIGINIDITERKKAERELKESEELYHEFFNNPLIGFAQCEIITNNKGDPEDFVYLEVNRTFENFTGLKRNDVISKKATEIFPYEEISELILIYGKVALSGKSTYFHYPIPTLNKFYEVSAFSNKKNQFIALFTDITKRKKVEVELKQSEARFRSVFNNSPIVIYRFNLQTGLYEYMSPAIKNLDFEPEELMVMSNEEVISRVHPEDRPALLSVLSKIDEIGKGESQYRFRGNNGEYRWWSNQMVIINDSQNKPLYRDGFVRDITKLKRAEEHKQELLEKEQQLTEELQVANEELINQQDELRNLVDKLKLSNDELEQFAYVASHDLQEPLRMVASFTQLLEYRYKDKLDTDADEYIDFIIEGAHRMKDLIDDLLTFSRLNTQKNEFKFTDLNQVLESVLLGLKSTIEEEDAHITSDSLPTVSCDSSQISQVFQNLISNSIKFHQTPPVIHVSAEENEKEWILGVSDKGIGIDPDHHQKIFDVFRRLHTREEYAGTGIGLSICKRIVERHNGRIWVESEPGKGTNFYFTIPQV